MAVLPLINANDNARNAKSDDSAASKTPVERAFARAVDVASDAERTNAYTAETLQRLLQQIKRTSDELKFRGQEREQLTSMVGRCSLTPG